MYSFCARHRIHPKMSWFPRSAKQTRLFFFYAETAAIVRAASRLLPLEQLNPHEPEEFNTLLFAILEHSRDPKLPRMSMVIRQHLQMILQSAPPTELNIQQTL